MDGKSSMCYTWNIFNLVNRFVLDIYNIYVKDVLLYCDPLEIKLLFQKIKKESRRYNRLKTYDTSKYEFIYKINKIDQKNGIFYNYGYYYHVSNIDTEYFVPEPELAFSPESINSIELILTDEDNINRSVTIKNRLGEKFISHILNYSTKESRLSTLLYYYLQKYLNDNGKIISTKIEIDGSIIDIDHDKELGIIYDELETLLYR